MKTIALTTAAALCAILALTAADKESPKPAPDAPKPAPTEKSDETPAPPGPRYRVISAFTASHAPAVPGESEKRRAALEETLNKADADGYQLAGMNSDWVVLERKPAPVKGNRRRVVLPTQ